MRRTRCGCQPPRVLDSAARRRDFALLPRQGFYVTVIWLALAVHGMAAPARADELVPELNAFVKLSSQARLYMLANVTGSSDADTVDGEVGIHADYTLKPILRRELRDTNWERDRYFWARLGYLYLENLDGKPDAAAENRVLLQFTARAELPLRIWLVNRAGVDFRDRDGERSNRYRYRLGAEKEFQTAGGTPVIPYVQAEWFYDTRFDAWSRKTYQAGVDLELNKQWRVEPYYAYETNTQPGDTKTNRVGLVLKLYF